MWISETWAFGSSIFIMWTSKTWTSKVLMFETWGSKTWTSETWAFEAWTSKISSSKDWTFETLLMILEIGSMTSETWGFVGETYFEVFTSTIFVFVFTSFGWHSILDVLVIWISWFFTCSLSELSNSFLPQT